MAADIYFGLMSGTSLDGIDAVAVEFTDEQHPRILAEAYIEFEPALRKALFALQSPGDNEIDREARAANQLTGYYALAIRELLGRTCLRPAQVRAVGVHGQTIRHCPEMGYTRQTHNPALLAELTSIDIIADFRSRDIAAGGQGAPLVPAFHATLFRADNETRVICNIGGISNLTILPPNNQGEIIGFDCGPGNMLLDYWAKHQLSKPYDDNGKFAASGQINDPLLAELLTEPYFEANPPKSTGRDLFNSSWLNKKLEKFSSLPSADVQATLTALTATSIANDIIRSASECKKVYLCGGGTRNSTLVSALANALTKLGRPDIAVAPTDALGIPAYQIEALAFAWLAMRFIKGQPGNLSSVTGATGPRVLGALYPR